MTQSWIRPPVEDLMFFLFARPPHPEFFDSARERRIEKPNFTLSVWLTSTGHVLSWRTPTHSLSEFTASRKQGLPRKRSLLHRRFQGEQKGVVAIGNGMQYHMMNQVEVMPADRFVSTHQDLIHRGAEKGLFHTFGEHHRFALPALGWVTVEAMRDSLFISAVHTFPDDLTVVKTLSIIEPERRDH